MAILDLEALLKPVSDDAPCGPDLTFDPALSALETLARGKPAQEFMDASGKTIVIAGEEPAWRELKREAEALFRRTKDVRVLGLLAAAAVREGGIEGCRDSLVLLQGTLERYWDQLYPALDPDDRDPTIRLNAVAALAAPMDTSGDLIGFVAKVLDAPLASSRRLGRYGLRHHRIARGELPAVASADPQAPPPADTATIDGALADTPPETLKATRAALAESAAAVEAIRKLLVDRVGADRAPSFAPLESVLRDAGALLDARLGSPAGEDTAGPAGMSDPTSSPDAVGGGGGAGKPLSGEIRSSADVMLALEKVCRYYDRSEVSSPVPMVLAAARRLVGRKFTEISRVLTPDAIRLLEEIGSPPQEKQEAT